GVSEAEEGAEPPTTCVDGEEDGVVDQVEDLAGDEVKRVAERFRFRPVGSEGGAKQKWDVHAGEVELVCGAMRSSAGWCRQSRLRWHPRCSLTDLFESGGGADRCQMAQPL